MKKIRNLFKMVSFTALVLVTSMVAGQIVRPLRTDVAVKNVETFHQMEENTVDVMVLGSSHAWRGIDTVTMYEEYGIAAYNYANNWQHINTTAMFLQDALLTQSPKVVVIDTVSACKFMSDVDINGEVYYTTKLKNTPEKFKYVQQYLGNDIGRYIKYYFPVVAFHDTWNTVTAENFKHTTCEKDFAASMGYLYTKKSRPTKIKDYTTFPQKEFTKDCIGALDDIVSTCKDRNIELVFITLPWGNVKYKYLEAMEKYAKENDCPYINMFDNYEEVGIDPEKDYYDAQHLNYSGAVKVGKYLGEYIKNNYEVDDIRKDKVRNEIWSNASTAFKEEREKANLPDDTE